MTYRGRVKNGVVVLESGVHLREGTDVRVEPVGETEGAAEKPQEAQQLREGLLTFSGVIKDGPSDLARNHDRRSPFRASGIPRADEVGIHSRRNN
jgi:hypothetical protein